MKKYAIIGSRTFGDYDLVKKTMDGFDDIELIVSGGAKGADSLAERYADEEGFEKKIFHADWDNLGRKAGPLRNTQIVEFADVVVCFWDGSSRGTLDSITKARILKKEVVIINF